MAIESLFPRPVEGFTLRENIWARDLERTLGLSFKGTYPCVIALDADNIAHLKMTDRHTYKHVVVRYAEGAYIPEYDAIFVNPQDMFTNVVDWHENLHGYLARQNPFFAMSEGKMDKIYHDNREQVVVAYAFSEGMAEAGTIEMLRRQLPTHATLREMGFLYGADDTAEAVLVRPEMGNAFSALARGIKLLNFINPRRGAVSGFGDLIVSKRLQGMLYPTGYFFCKFVMKELLGAGMSFAQAYKLLAQDQPTSVEELKQPQQYAQRLLAQESGLQA